VTNTSFVLAVQPKQQTNSKLLLTMRAPQCERRAAHNYSKAALCGVCGACASCIAATAETGGMYDATRTSRYIVRAWR